MPIKYVCTEGEEKVGEMAHFVYDSNDELSEMHIRGGNGS